MLSEQQKNDLLEIIKIPTKSGKEFFVSKFIRSKLESMGIPYGVDKVGNIFNFIPNTPLLCAHMDAVTSDGANLWLKEFIEMTPRYIHGFSNLGADDKVGVFMILETLKTKNVSFLFTVHEEDTREGSSVAIVEHKDAIASCLYYIVLDRRGGEDVICSHSKNRYGTKEFENDLLASIGSLGFKSVEGFVSDANNLNKLLSGCNLSVGYYNPHSENEFIDMKNVDNTLQAITIVIESLTKQYAPPPPPVKVKVNNKKKKKSFLSSIFRF